MSEAIPTVVPTEILEGLPGGKALVDTNERHLAFVKEATESAKNLTELAKASAEAPVPAPLSYQMPPRLHAEMTKLNQQLGQVKLALADKLLALRAQEQVVASLTQELRALEESALHDNKELNSRMEGFVRAQDLDLSDPTSGRWRFDVVAGTLTRIS